jgi:hypothetical protein
MNNIGGVGQRKKKVDEYYFYWTVFGPVNWAI